MASKRHKAYELTGKVILVDPAFATKDESGKPGIILSVTPENRLAHVEFNDGTQADYAIEKLIALAPEAMIMQRLMGNWEINPQDFKAALKICRLMSEKKFTEAMELAVSNDTTTTLCAMSCQSWLALQNKRNNKHNGLRR